MQRIRSGNVTKMFLSGNQHFKKKMKVQIISPMLIIMGKVIECPLVSKVVEDITYGLRMKLA